LKRSFVSIVRKAIFLAERFCDAGLSPLGCIGAGPIRTSAEASPSAVAGSARASETGIPFRELAASGVEHFGVCGLVHP